MAWKDNVAVNPMQAAMAFKGHLSKEDCSRIALAFNAEARELTSLPDAGINEEDLQLRHQYRHIRAKMLFDMALALVGEDKAQAIALIGNMPRFDNEVFAVN
jgi:hypothetical protein